jgi:hypothetical protein
MPGAGRLGPGGRCAVLVKLQSMAGDVRGHDLGSWWRNRIAYRDDVRLLVDQWRMTSATFAHAAAGAPPAAVAAPPDEPFASVTQAGNAMIAAIQRAEQELGNLDVQRSAAQAEFNAAQAAVDTDCRKRVQAERQEANRSAQAMADRVDKGKVFARRLIAVAIFVVVAYLLLEF